MSMEELWLTGTDLGKGFNSRLVRACNACNICTTVKRTNLKWKPSLQTLSEFTPVSFRSQNIDWQWRHNNQHNDTQRDGLTLLHSAEIKTFYSVVWCLIKGNESHSTTNLMKEETTQNIYLLWLTFYLSYSVNIFRHFSNGHFPNPHHFQSWPTWHLQLS